MKNKLNYLSFKIKDLFHRNKQYIPYLLVPQIVVFIVFSVIYSHHKIFPFGDNSVAWCDLKQQGIPLLMNLKDALSGNGSVIYSFNNASGMNFWGVFLFFLSNPFSLLCIFFEKADIYKLVSLLMVLKLCTAAATSTLFFIKRNRILPLYFSSILGLSYSLCAYGLMYYQNLMWLDLMYLYPLLALGFQRITENKGYGLYTVVLALCVIYNFYLSYMIVLAVLIIVGVYLIVSTQDKEYKRKRALDFFKGSALAAMLSGFSWIPAFIQYGNSGRGEDIIETLKTSSWGTAQNTIFLLFLSSTIIIISLFSLIKPDRKRVSIIISFVLFAIPVFVEPINKMWHTGSYMAFTGRYAFITIFTGLELVALALENQLELGFITRAKEKIPSYGKKLLIVFTLIIGAFVIGLLYKELSIDTFVENKKELSKFTDSLWGDKAQMAVTLKVGIIFAIVYFVIALLYKFKILSKAIFAIFLTGVIVCEGVFAINSYVITASSRNIFDGYEDFLDLEGKISDEDFYRIKTEKKYQDTNLLGALGYNSIGHYTSLTNLEYMNVAKALGYSSSWMELSTYGGTELSNAILGVRYNVIAKQVKDSVYSNDTYSIVKTFGALGLGVKYSGENDEFSYMDSTRVDFQEKIFASLFESDEALFEKYNPGITLGCNITQSDSKTVIKGKGEIVYPVHVKGKQTLYFDAFGEFSNNLRQVINKGFIVYVNNKKVADYPDGMYTGFMDLGTYCDETVKIRVVTTKSTMELLSYGVYGLKHDVLKNALDKKESGYLTARDNEVTGTLTAKAGEHLFIAVPYDDGFKITLNGKKIEGKKVFGDFYSIPLVEGENKIVMTYTPKGLVLGIITCILGIIIAIILRIRVVKKRKLRNTSGKAVKTTDSLGGSSCENHDNMVDDFENTRPAKKREILFSGTFITLFVVVIIVVYIAPVILNLLG